MERMTWIAELYDRMSGPSRRISRNLNMMNAGLLQGRASLGGMGAAAQTTSSRFLQLGAGLGGWAMLARTAWDTASGLGRSILDVGYAIGKAAFENFAFKESALATGKALWGSADAAQEMFDKASKLAKLTPFNVKEVTSAFNKLGAAGFAAEEVPVVFQGLSDIASMSGKGADAIGSLSLAFSQMMGRGKLQSQELNQITEAAGGAVSRLKLFAEIAKIMGVAETSIESMMENGLIPARVGIMGVMQVAKQLGGGIIGQNSIEQSKTLGGLWSNLEDTITNLWLTMDLTKAPWFTAVKSFMAGLVEALDTSSRSGKHLQQVFNRLFGETIGRFIGAGTQDMGETIVKLADAFETVAMHAIAAFEGLWDGLKVGFGPLLDGLGAMGDMGLEDTHDLFEAIGIAVGDIVLGMAALGAGVVMLVTPFRWLSDSLRGLWNSLVNITDGLLTMNGDNILAGFRQLVGMGPMEVVGNEMGAGLNQGFAGAIDAHSPSRVFEGFGENVVDGFNRGVERVPGMDASLGDELVAGATKLSAPGGAGGGTTVALTVNVNAPGGDGPAIAQTLRDFLPSAVAQLFDQMATERGAT